MVGMPSFPIRQNDRLRPRQADLLGKRGPVLDGGRQPRVTEVHTNPEPGAQHLARRLGLLRPDLRRTASAHFALRQVQNAHGVPFIDHLEQGAGASQLHIVGMGGNRQNVYSFHSFFTLFSSSASLTRYLKALLPLMKTTGISIPYADSR